VLELVLMLMLMLMLQLVFVLVLVLVLVFVLGHPQIDLVVVATSEATQVATTTKSIAGASSGGDCSRGEWVSPVAFVSAVEDARSCSPIASLTVVGALFTPRMEPQYDCYGNA